MRTQIEYLINAIVLAQQNPEMEIIIAVDNDELAENGSWTKHKIKSAEISCYYEEDEKIFTDLDELIDDMEYRLDRRVPEDEAMAKMKQVILIKTGGE